MDSRDPDELITEAKEEQQTRGELATEALQWFLDGNVGELFPRSDVVDRLSNELDIPKRQANTAISDTVGDIVDPVQQIVKSNKKYVGVIDYKLFNDEGAYGYVDFNDRKGKRKRVVCARCVEKHTFDENVIHATQGEGTSNLDATWQQLLNKVTSHYTTQHNTKPSNVEPGASLVNGTTISGNTAFHQGNLTDRGAVNITPSTTNQTIPKGFHNGDGVVQGDSNLTASNIKEGVNIFGVSGNVSPFAEALINSGNGNDLESFYNNKAAQFDKFVNSTSGAQELINSTLGLSLFTSAQPAANDLANSEVAMQEVADSPTAMQEIVDTPTAMQEVADSPTAMQEVISSQGALEKVVNSPTAMDELASSETGMQEVADSQTAMAEVANTKTAISAIGSNEHENITANTVLNSSTATSEFQDSNLEESFVENFQDSRFVGSRNLIDARILVTSNNENGAEGTGVNFDNDVGPETEGGSTFIINEARLNSGNKTQSGSVGINGILIDN